MFVCVCMCVGRKAGSVVTVAGICPAIDGDTEGIEREREKEN